MHDDVRWLLWDLHILREVIIDDVYRIKTLKFTPTNVFDIGAHIGGFTILIKKLYPMCHVLCCEPNIETYRHLMRNVVDYYDVTALNCGVSSSNGCGSSTPASEDNNSGSCRLVVDNIGNIKVKCITNLIAEYGVPDLLKTDCEGYEVAIIEKLANDGLLDQIRCVVGELHDGVGIEWATKMFGHRQHFGFKKCKHGLSLFWAASE